MADFAELDSSIYKLFNIELVLRSWISSASVKFARKRNKKEAKYDIQYFFQLFYIRWKGLTLKGELFLSREHTIHLTIIGFLND